MVHRVFVPFVVLGAAALASCGYDLPPAADLEVHFQEAVAEVAKQVEAEREAKATLRITSRNEIHRVLEETSSAIAPLFGQTPRQWADLFSC